MSEIGLDRPIPAAARPDGAIASLLLVSDVRSWSDEMGQGLAAEGFHVRRDVTGAAAFDEAVLAGLDVAVIDQRLAHQSALAVCGAIRSRGHLPMIVVGPAGDEGALLAAFAAGADQYTYTDTSLRQLVARVRAVMRRFPRSPGAPGVAAAPDLVIDDVLGVAIGDGFTVRLSRDEVQVLGALIARPGRVVPRQSLLGPWDDLAEARRLDRVIRRLRHKLESVDGRRRISAVRGVGFRYEPDGSR